MNLHIFHRQAFVFDFVSFKLSGSLKKMPGFFFAFLSLFFFYFRNSGFRNRGFGNYANVYRLNYRLLSANIWCMLLYLENVFFRNAVSEVFYAILNSLLVLGFCCFCVCRILLLKAKKLLLLIAEAISENLFFEPRSEVFWGLFLLYCDARKKDFDASNKPSQCFKWTIAMVYSLYSDALSTYFMCSVFIEDKTWINRDIEQRSL